MLPSRRHYYTLPVTLPSEPTVADLKALCWPDPLDPVYVNDLS